MNRRLTLYLMLCIMVLTPWGARAAQVLDDVYYKNEKAYIEARQEVIEEKYDVFARCQIEVQQYLDEHPKLIARSIGNVMNTIQNNCMRASGYPPLPKPNDTVADRYRAFCNITWDTNDRIRKRWTASSKDVRWLDQYLRESDTYSGRSVWHCAF
jgi:hypothetical protein